MLVSEVGAVIERRERNPLGFPATSSHLFPELQVPLPPCTLSIGSSTVRCWSSEGVNGFARGRGVEWGCGVL